VNILIEIDYGERAVGILEMLRAKKNVMVEEKRLLKRLL